MVDISNNHWYPNQQFWSFVLENSVCKNVYYMLVDKLYPERPYANEQASDYGSLTLCQLWKKCIWKYLLLKSSAAWKLLILVYRQIVWAQIWLFLEEQPDLGPHCLQHRHFKQINRRYSRRYSRQYEYVVMISSRRVNSLYDWRFLSQCCFILSMPIVEDLTSSVKLPFFLYLYISEQTHFLKMMFS